MCLWRRGGDNIKSETVAAFLSALEGISTARKYLIMFDVHRNVMAFLSNVMYNTYRVHLNVKYQQLIVMDNWRSELFITFVKALCLARLHV